MKDRWLRIIGIPLVSLPFPFLNHRVGTADFYWSFVVSLASTALIWEGTRYFMVGLRRWLAWDRRPIQHLVTQALISSVYAVIVVCVGYYISYRFIYHKEISGLHVRQTAAIAVMLTLMVNAIYEGIYFSQQWRANFIRGEVLRRTNLRSQLESLTHQVNPHFLFNSLTTLTTLIEDNPALAKRFVAGLARLYEYVLDSRAHSLVSLQKEIEFVKTYVFLLQMRFGESLMFSMSVPEHILSSQIPPLTLQLLVENAVKHNSLSPEEPLSITLTADGDRLAVVNTIRKKGVMETSTGIGLKNIIERYRYFADSPVTFSDTGNVFRVDLPLLK